MDEIPDADEFFKEEPKVFDSIEFARAKIQLVLKERKRSMRQFCGKVSTGDEISVQLDVLDETMNTIKKEMETKGYAIRISNFGMPTIHISKKKDTEKVCSWTENLDS